MIIIDFDFDFVGLLRMIDLINPIIALILD